MLLTTTSTIEGQKIITYHGIIAAEVVVGTNFITDMLSSVTDFLGGRSGGYEQELNQARQQAQNSLSQKVSSLGANAIVGVKIDYESINQMLMVSIIGTAVSID